MEKYSDTKYNVVALLVAAALALIGVATADYDNGEGMALLVLIWLPIVVVIFALVIFFLLKRFAPKLAWLPTLFAVGFLLLLAGSAFMD